MCGDHQANSEAHGWWVSIAVKHTLITDAAPVTRCLFQRCKPFSTPQETQRTPVLQERRKGLRPFAASSIGPSKTRPSFIMRNSTLLQLKRLFNTSENIVWVSRIGRLFDVGLHRGSRRRGEQHHGKGSATMSRSIFARHAEAEGTEAVS